MATLETKICPECRGEMKRMTAADYERMGLNQAAPSVETYVCSNSDCESNVPVQRRT
jgi:hypothetical protein